MSLCFGDRSVQLSNLFHLQQKFSTPPSQIVFLNWFSFPFACVFGVFCIISVFGILAGSTTMRVWAAHQRWTKKQIHDCVDQATSHFLGLVADKVSFFESAKRKTKNKDERIFSIISFILCRLRSFEASVVAFFGNFKISNYGGIIIFISNITEVRSVSRMNDLRESPRLCRRVNTPSVSNHVQYLLFTIFGF
ncbi:hypothetical protein K440DRAFT_105568 [Wilcoxina mikolae CBS 423.85]|nr:hypothetical protein K440DRAFT_105568 [Wilcoxina mikolae CBS 423.85]